MPNRVEELFAELAESAGGQQQFQIDQQLRQMEAERELYDTDEARTALKIMGGLLTLGIPLPGMRALGLGKLGKPLINKSYGAVGGDMVSQTLKAIEQGTIGRSGSGVGADVAGRYALPKAKPSVVTKQGPRGPINIDSPKQIPLKGLKDPRYTKGISATERAQLPTRRLSKPKWVRDPYYPLEAKNVPEALTKASLNRGRPYPGPHLTVEEGLKKLVPLRITGKAKEATWYQHPKTGELYQYHYGSGALARGFYKRGKDAVGTPQHARKAAEEFNPNIIGARTSVREGGITATKAARETQVQIKKLERWKRSHEAKVRRGDDQYQEGMRSGYEPDIKGGEKMMRESRKRIQEIQAKLDELNK